MIDEAHQILSEEDFHPSTVLENLWTCRVQSPTDIHLTASLPKRLRTQFLSHTCIPPPRLPSFVLPTLWFQERTTSEGNLTYQQKQSTLSSPTTFLSDASTTNTNRCNKKSTEMNSVYRGSCIIIPSAMVRHSNASVGEMEKRYSIAQYSASGLFRWVLVLLLL